MGWCRVRRPVTNLHCLDRVRVKARLSGRRSDGGGSEGCDWVKRSARTRGEIQQLHVARVWSERGPLTLTRRTFCCWTLGAEI